MTWALIAWCGLTVLWAVAGASTASNTGHDCARQSNAYLSRHACEQAGNVGTGIGVAIILVFGFCGFIVLSLIWFMTRPRTEVK